MDAIPVPQSAPAMSVSQIRQLPTLLVNQIAAGEVIERPASVVKELVENAIDANASRIRVSIERGGIELVEVVDDGSGMPPDDLPLSVTAHATSKVASEKDLDAIATLGFRGEAMASILSVSRMTIVSRTTNAIGAHRIQGEGDQVQPIEPCAGPPGTTVTVRNLFFNTPARRKFLRTELTEYNHVNAQMIRAALSNPGIGFTFINNGKSIIDVAANQSLRDRVLDILGRELGNELLEINADQRGPQRTMSLWGLVGTPDLARGTNKYQYVFLNGRPIRDRTVLHAIREAYRGLLDPLKHPMVVLYLEMDPSHVDVNVHPAKAEVRFRDSQSVHGLLYSTIRERLLNADITPIVGAGTGNKAKDDGPLGGMFRVSSNFTAWNVESSRSSGPTVSAEPKDAAPDEVTDGPTVDQRQLMEFVRNRDPRAGDASSSGFSLQEAREALGDESDSEKNENEETTVELENQARRVFQVHDSYLVIEENDGISIVDQHALHERVMFEALKARILEAPLESQRLLTPAVISLTEAQMELCDKVEPLFERLGIEAAPLGPTSLGIHAFPSFLFERQVDPVEFAMLLFDRALEDGFIPEEEEALHDVLDMMACKAAVKAGDRMTEHELQKLLETSEQIERASRCPHGRPTTIRVSLVDLEKQFGRR